MVDSSEWGSSQDPRRWAQRYDERNQALRPVSQSFSSLFNQMPEEVKKRVRTNKHIQTVYKQFAQVVDEYILEHTNSVYLLKPKDALASYEKNTPLQRTDNKDNHCKTSDSRSDKQDTSESQNIYDLVVYVDNSLVSAELNARRELIRLKYREQFNIILDVFEIRISRGTYKEKYPFRDLLKQSQNVVSRELTKEEEDDIKKIVEGISEGRLKDSFTKAITAQKRNSIKNE